MGERVPQHVQNIIIRNYCQNNNYQYLLSAAEYAMPNSHLILNQTIMESNNYDGIIAYSLFQLPENKHERFTMIKNLILKKKQFHFAVESLKISTFKEFEELDRIWQIRQTFEK